jgi:hypothetical protein
VEALCNGSVGSQALLGIPYLKKLRDDEALKELISVWPFETGCTLPPRADAPRVILAEMYPSMVPVAADLQGHVKDRGQIESIARFFACKDAAGALAGLFEAPTTLSADALVAVREEEGWILGVVPSGL